MDIEDIVILPPQELLIREPFSTLFKPRDDVVKRIATSMKETGFDPSHPVHVWRKENCLVDGHQRAIAAIESGIEVYAYFHDFESEDSALDYAIRNQRDRRNLTDAELLRVIKAVDGRKSKGGDRKSEQAKSMVPHGTIDRNRSSEDTARKVGTTKKKVDNARTVLADPVEAAAVESGEKTLSRAANDARAKKRKPRDPANPSKPRKPKADPVPSPGPVPEELESLPVEPVEPVAPMPFNATDRFMPLHRAILDEFERWPECERKSFARKLLMLAEELKKETGLVMKEVTIDAKAG